MKNFLAYFSLLFLFVQCSKIETPAPTGAVVSKIKTTPAKGRSLGDGTTLLRLNGTQIVDQNNNPVRLQGIAFSNFVWSDSPVPQKHHEEIDFQRVKNMGMNTIRFYMNYRFFEDDSKPYVYKQSGWEWLDRNIAWAKKHGIYLVLNMHVPQGGYQSHGEGAALWRDSRNQGRLVALWKAISERYKNEGQIAGYGLVNEPLPTASLSQWSSLAQRLVNGIRSVGDNHLLFVERAISVNGKFEPGANLKFPVVTGDNLVYEFHGYIPHEFTHQALPFTDFGDGGRYPDESIIETSDTKWHTAIFNNPTLNPGTTGWTYFKGERYTVEDRSIAMASPALVGTKVGGRVYFDDIIVQEFDRMGSFVQNIRIYSLNDEEDWYYWSPNGSGRSGLSTTVRRNGTGSLYIEGASGDGNLSNRRQAFVPKIGYSYQINGWMKGDGVSSNANCQIRLDFSKANGPVLARNKDFLASRVDAVKDWADAKGVAVYMGEFGASKSCFQNGKGGFQWATDMTQILRERNIPFTYHVYLGDAFGLYLGGGLANPGNVNRPLIDWFTENLK